MKLSCIAGTNTAYGGYYTLNSTDGTFEADSNLTRGVSAFLVEQGNAEQWYNANIDTGVAVAVSMSFHSALTCIVL